MSSASSWAACHSPFPITCLQSSAVKSLSMPGAIWAAIMAASMGMVPLPQKGSTNIRSPFQGVSMIMAAARFSAMGAWATSLR